MPMANNVPSSVVTADRLRALVFDWAGTTVDFGSLAPVRTLQKVFEQFGVPVTESETRRDMGLPKRDHLAAILSIERVQAAWQDSYHRAPIEFDTATLYECFVPLQFECLAQYSTVIHGVRQAVERARSRGLRIGSTTGYTRAMLDTLLASSTREGFTPECSVTPEEVGAGRPLPFMIFENAIRLRVYPLGAIAKIGDTVADIHEGLNAGAWSIGVAATGNMVGLSKHDLDALPEADRAERLRAARERLQQAGAHYVIDTLDELEDVLDDIDLRLRTAPAGH